MSARRGLLWPVLLIALGLLFLLGNLGVISGVSWLAIANLWPLLLILIGIDIAFARRWPLATLGVEVAVIIAGLALAASVPTYGRFFPFPQRGGGGTDVSAPRSGTESLSLAINGGAGRYRVSGGAAALVEAHSDDPDLRIRVSTRQGRTDVRLDQTVPESISVFRSGANVEVRIASDVRTSLDLNAGAGEFDVDLSDVRIGDARVNTGAATTRVTLPKPTGDVPVRINAGASNLVVIVPDGIEARVSTTGGLLSLRSENPRLGESSTAVGCIACGSGVQTNGYGSATDRVTVTISAGASSIVVR